MDQKEIVEGSRLIQEFMGWRLEGRPSLITGEMLYSFVRYNEKGEEIDTHDGGDSWNWNRESTLPYDSDYNWLMSVVEKIEQGNYGFKMCRKVVEVYFDDSKGVVLKTKEDCRLNSLYKAVCEFIKWHNKQNIK